MSLSNANAKTLPTNATEVQFDNQTQVTTDFSPRGGAIQAAANFIRQAKSQVLIAAYGFTSPEIAQAIVDVYKRNIKIQVVLDRSNKKAKYSSTNFLANSGVDVRINSKYAIMHHKFIVVDDKLALGSMNFSRAGETRNAENFNIFTGSQKLTDVYA